MASAIIHIAVAKLVKEKMNFNLNEKHYYLGTIAPDISKEINRPREESHFIKDNTIEIEKFIEKYSKHLKNPFELGYLIHLYTDYLWMDFINENKLNKKLKKLNIKQLEITQEKLIELIYNDYSNFNILILDEYEIDLSLFYENFEYPSIYIEEIPNNLLNIIVSKMGIISANSKLNKTYVFDFDEIKQFIEYASDYCIKKINKLIK